MKQHPVEMKFAEKRNCYYDETRVLAHQSIKSVFRIFGILGEREREEITNDASRQKMKWEKDID